MHLKIAELMGTDLHVFGQETNQNSVTMPILKQRLVVTFKAQRMANLEHQTREHVPKSSLKYALGGKYQKAGPMQSCFYQA